MGREIFGPVLAIVPVKDLDESIAFIRARCVHVSRLLFAMLNTARREYPLAVYVFTHDPEFEKKGGCLVLPANAGDD